MTMDRRVRAILAMATAFLAVATGLRAQPTPEQHFYFATVAINDIGQGDAFPVLETADGFFLDARAFEPLGLVKPEAPEIRYSAFDLLPLQAVPGLTYSFNPQQLHLDISCTAACFPHHELVSDWRFRPADEAPFGAFLNYDLSADIGDGTDFVGGLTELNVFSRHGRGNLTFAGRDLTGDARATRLETSWTIDYPGRRQRLDIGDATTPSSGWGRPVRFAGVQFGTDFALQPGFITFPTPAISGAASLPSTADIYVNDVRRTSFDVEPGPFTIRHLPVITGAGDLKVVVRDLLGRETVLVQPFYANRDLLSAGLSSFSLTGGALRRNYGTTSFDYGEPFVAGSYRRGLSDGFTAGFHMEASAKRAGIGPYLDWRLPFGGVLSSSAALSLKGGQVGGLLQVDASWSSQVFGIYLSNEMATADFTRLGEADGLHPARMRSSGNIGVDLQEKGSLSVNYTRIDERDRRDFEILGATYSVQLGKLGGLGVNFSRRFGSERETSVFISLTTRLGDRTSGNATLEKSGSDWASSLRLNQNAPYEGGFGYRAEVREDGTESGRAGVTYNSAKGIASLDVSHWYGRDVARLGLQGGVVLMRGGPYLARPIYESFALAEVKGFKDVTVMQDNRPVARTNADGHALITGLRAFEENRLSIDPLDLPLSADIGKTALKVVPARRSGVVASFPVVAVTAALFRIMDEDGKLLPPGTVLHALDGGDDAPVGFGGQSYIQGLERTRTFLVHIGETSCTLEIAAVTGPQPPMRQLVCKRNGK